jgi:hypothetical protein
MIQGKSADGSDGSIVAFDGRPDDPMYTGESAGSRDE